MPSKLCKWGNSLGVRLPQYIAERTGLSAGDYLYVRLTDAGDIVIHPVKARDIPAGYQSGDLPPQVVNEALTEAEVLADWYR